MSHLASGLVRRAFVVAAAAAITGTMSPHAQEFARAIPASPAPDWEHIWVVAQRLGVPRTVVFGAPPSRSVAIGDFDGDSHADIAVGAARASEVVVLLGGSSAPFRTAVAARRADWSTVDAETHVNGVGYRAQSSLISSTTTIGYRRDEARPAADTAAAGDFGLIADFDGDGTVDLAAAAATSAELRVYTGGKSGAARTIMLDAPPVGLASGDFDGDDVTDLVVANRSSSLTLLFGAGSFGKSRTIDVGIVPASHGLAVSDIDRDGAADVVVLGDDFRDVNILLGDGRGGLMPYASATVELSSPPAESARIKSASIAADGYEGVASIALNPSTIAGGSGATSTGTITLNAPAPAGGVVVTLTSSNLDLAASVPSLTVPAGATSGTFTIGTNRNYRRYSGLAFSVTISAAHETTTRSATLTVTAQPPPGPLSSFDVQNEGPMCFGVGVRQTTSGHELEFGSAGNLFDCRPPDNPVGQDGTCTFRQECSLGCELRPPANGSQFNDVCATSGPFPVAVNPRLVVGGNPSIASLRLSAAAPASSSGRLSSGTVFANTIPSIRFPIPAGDTIGTADVLTARVTSPQFAPVDGDYFTPRADGSRGGRIGLAWLALVPGSAPPFRLTSFDFDPATLTSVTGGATFFAFGQMNQVAPAPGIASATMTVSSSDPSAASIPQPTVTFTEGSSRAGVGIQTHAVSSDRIVTISAVVGDTTLSRQLTVRATPGATRASSFFLEPLIVTGGEPSAGTVVLNGVAPSGGAVVTLRSFDPAVAAMPATVTVPAGSDRVNFTVQTCAVPADTNVNVSATYGNGSAFSSLIVLAPPAPVTLTSVTVSPSSVTGGNSSTGTVNLSAAAESGGAVVSVSDNSTAATTPASVTVPAGATSASFTITTTTVTASTSATISATFEGATRTVNLMVNPSTSSTPAAPTLVAPANDATVAQPVTLDWNAVTNAAGYEVQVDNSSTISAPFVASATVTQSPTTLSGLPAQQLWWRVRARNAAGVAGPFSSTRRFTPQTASTPPGQAVTLTVTATGRSGERVTSNPAGINVAVGSTASAPFTSGTSIRLSVTNGRDAVWSGACSSNGNKTRTCTFTLNGNGAVTANVQ
jgi:hypothetical protein